MNLTEKLSQERRGRLAAERLLELKSRELFEANKKLSLHALALSDSLVEQRAETATARSEAAQLKGKNTEVAAELIKAEEAAGIAERRLWDSVETMTDGFAVFDAQDQLIAANRAWMSLFSGLEEFQVGSTYMEMLQLCVGEGLVDIGDQGPSEWLTDMLHRWDQPNMPDKIVRLWNGRHLRLVDRRARDGDMVCLALDISSTIRKEEELKEARGRAEAASLAKSAFLAKMSHELRTPMNGVVGIADLLLENEDDDERRTLVNTIRNSGEALLNIINDVLDFSKLEAGRMNLQLHPFNLERIVYEVALLAQNSVGDRDLELVVDYDMFLGTSFMGDAGRIRQALTNLVGNAVKFTQSGHVLIRLVRVDTQPKTEDHRVHIVVEDTGIGIDKKLQEHIFGQFNQVEDAQNRKYEGTGLGLSITRQLIEMMGGEIWVESEPGKGATFGFALTLQAVESAMPEAFKPVNGPMHAVVVMKDTLGREVLLRQMVQLGIQVMVLSTGSEVLELLRESHGFDLLIADSELEDTRGLGLAKVLRSMGQNLPILMVASSHLVDFKAQDKALVTAVMRRPVLRDDLIRALNCLPKDGAPPVVAPLPTPAPPAPEPPAPLEGERRMRILAAEDNRTNQLVFRKILKGLDIDLTIVENGALAVEAWERDPPDLIFMDISMPELDGKEATRRIRAKERETGRERVPVVAMTAHAMAGDDTEILAAGLDHYLTKPLKKGLILQQIELHAPEGLSPIPVPEEAPPSSVQQSA